MAISPVIRGTVKKGRFFPYIVELFKKAFLQHEGKEVEVVVRLPKKGRSVEQNRYMWGVVYEIISQETGSEPEEVHEAMRMRFLLKQTKKWGPVAKSTQKLTTAEMEEYLMKIRTLMSQEYGIFIPLPNECDY